MLLVYELLGVFVCPADNYLSPTIHDCLSVLLLIRFLCLLRTVVPCDMLDCHACITSECVSMCVTLIM